VAGRGRLAHHVEVLPAHLAVAFGLGESIEGLSVPVVGGSAQPALGIAVIATLLAQLVEPEGGIGVAGLGRRY